MVMMGIEYMGEPPFSEVNIHSVVQAPDGRRMSKSLGTGIDPLELIEEHGADALRFGLLHMSSTQDVRFNVGSVQQGRALVTKLWNANRLVIERGGRVQPEPPVAELLADRWIVSRVTAFVEEAQALVAGFRLSAYVDGLYHLVFDDYCDWYLELLKGGQASIDVASYVLEQLLALVHPVMPFMSEEAWAAIPGSEGMMLTHPPARAPGPRDKDAERQIGRLHEAVRGLRAVRTERGLRPRTPLLVGGAALSHLPTEATAVDSFAPDAEIDDGGAAVVGVSFGQLLVQVEGADSEADAEAERERIVGEIANVRAELARAQGKLDNEKFVERAPAEVVDIEREKARRYGDELAALEQELSGLDSRGP